MRGTKAKAIRRMIKDYTEDAFPYEEKTRYFKTIEGPIIVSPHCARSLYKQLKREYYGHPTSLFRN